MYATVIGFGVPPIQRVWLAVGWLAALIVGGATTMIAPGAEVTTKITPQVKLATFTRQ